tara:strand:+ start:508 stop:1155 length:648 start_codon:yes stop_codon:yes gene_type:complete
MPNIIEFKSRLNGGVRPNLYEVDINFPTGTGNQGTLKEQGQYLCRSASLPTHSQGLIEVPFRGRFLKIPGDRTFEAWTATFYNTQDFNLRAAFESWVNLGNQVDENIGVTGGYQNLMQDIYIRQLSKDSVDQPGQTGGVDKNKILRVYKLIGAWPTSVGSINVAFDSNDALEEFDVEFQFQYLDANAPNVSDPKSTESGFLSSQVVNKQTARVQG